jgi:fucose 4-O-acetylase-like acetyltransferase
MIKQGRLEYMDLLKGIAILLVVFGHLIQANTLESSRHPIFSYIYSFHIPLFMFLSGYVGFKSYNFTSIKEAIYRLSNKFRSLLIPYFIWPMIVYNFFLVTEYKFSLCNQIIDLVTKWNSLWFLWYLFILYCIYSINLLIYNIIKSKNKLLFDIISYSIFLCIGITLKYFKVALFVDIDSFILYSIFFFGGILISKYSFLSNFILNKIVFFVSSVVFLILIGQYNYFDLGIKNKIIKMIISGSAIISFYNLSLFFTKDSLIIRRLKYYGKYTLVIYVTHFTMLKLWTDSTTISNLSNLYTTIIILIMSVIVIETCILIKRIVSFSPYLDFILYGEKIRKNNRKL